MFELKIAFLTKLKNLFSCTQAVSAPTCKEMLDVLTTSGLQVKHFTLHQQLQVLSCMAKAGTY